MQQVQTVATQPPAPANRDRSSTATRQPDQERHGKQTTFLVVFSAPWRKPTVQIK